MIKDISELESVLTEEQKEKGKNLMDKIYPKGTPEIMCCSIDDGIDYLVEVDLSLFSGRILTRILSEMRKMHRGQSLFDVDPTTF